MKIKNFNCPYCGKDLDGLEVEVVTLSSAFAEKATCPACGKEFVIPKPELGKGFTLGDFVLDRRLGSGGMGEVWLARQTSVDRMVAVKILAPHLAQDPLYISRFLSEVKHSARLEHPNIVTTFGAGEESGIRYMAVGFVDGEGVDATIKRLGRIPEADALRTVRSVASALDYAWGDHQILHRDIKPANIMVDRKGNVKLMDMGISKTAGTESSMTMTGMMVGTPHYMSVEQATNREDIDFRSDVYSLGATLYHMTTGFVPFEAPTAMAVMMKHMNEALTPPREKCAEISDPCSALIETMMAKERDARHKSWADLISDIDLVLAGKYPATPRPGSDKTVFRSGRQPQSIGSTGSIRSDSNANDPIDPIDPAKATLWRKPIALASAAVAILALAAGLYSLMPGASPSPKDEAPPPVTTAPKAASASTQAAKNEGLYAIVDISGGPGAASYSVSYLDTAPADLLTNPDYKTSKIVMRRCPAGTFMMGETGKQHKVTLTKDFYIGVFEVTQGQWEKVMHSNPSKFKNVGPSGPVENGTWNGYNSYIEELNSKFKSARFRFPSEAEWEYACRAGTRGDRFEPLGEYEWYNATSKDITHEVGKKLPNPWGLYDVYGNVFEFCSDWMDDPLLKDMIDPTGPEIDTGKGKMIRGGCYNHNEMYCRSCHRAGIGISYARSNEGFRLAMSVDQPSSSAERIPSSEPKKPTASSPAAPAVDDATAEKMIKAAIEELKKKNSSQEKWNATFKKIQTGWSLNLFGNSEMVDILPLKGLPLSSLNIYGCPKLSDISALKGMPLNSLDAAGTEIADISALKGMPLNSLVLLNTQIVDISALKGMPLTALNLRSTKINDIAILNGMPLRDLKLNGVPVADIRAVKGLPLETLDLFGCAVLNDLSPLSDCKQLKKLSIPKHCNNIEFLRILPSLEILDNNKGTFDSKQTPAEFWKEWDAKNGGAKPAAAQLVPSGRQWESDLKLAEASLDAFRWDEAVALYEKAVAAMESDKKTDKAILDEYLAKTQKQLAEARFLSDRDKLPAETQLKIVLKKLSDINGAEIACESNKIEDGKIVSLSFKKQIKLVDIGVIRGMRLNSLDISECPISDLTPLKGMPLTSLDIHSTNVYDITALRNMKLESLICHKTKVQNLNLLSNMPLKILDIGLTPISSIDSLKTLKLHEINLQSLKIVDISPLKGMPIEHCSLYDCQNLADLTPLKGMPLKSLLLTRTKVADLSPLYGMPLENLNLDSCLVSDLTPLSMSPLKSLHITGCSNVKNYTPLADCNELKEIVGLLIDMHSAKELRSLKNLKTINRKPAEEFWKEWDSKNGNAKPAVVTSAAFPATAQQGASDEVSQILCLRKALKEANPEFEKEVGYEFDPKNNSIVGLNLSGLKISDLRPLAGLKLKSITLHGCDKIIDISVLKAMPIEGALDLSGTSMSSLEPLRGKNLTSIHLGYCGNVADLKPLRGMKLKSIMLHGCNVSDISVLKDMPLEGALDIYGCPIKDYSPLATCNRLESIFGLSKNAQGLEAIRELKNLKTINGKPAELFW